MDALSSSGQFDRLEAGLARRCLLPGKIPGKSRFARTAFPWCLVWACVPAGNRRALGGARRARYDVTAARPGRRYRAVRPLLWVGSTAPSASHNCAFCFASSLSSYSPAVPSKIPLSLSLSRGKSPPVDLHSPAGHGPLALVARITTTRAPSWRPRFGSSQSVIHRSTSDSFATLLRIVLTCAYLARLHCSSRKTNH